MHSTILMLSFDIVPVFIDFTVEVIHDCLIEVFCLGNVSLVTLECLPPGRIFGRVIVLDHSVVLLRHNITAVIEWFDLIGRRRHISCQSVLAKIYVALHLKV